MTAAVVERPVSRVRGTARSASAARSTGAGSAVEHAPRLVAVPDSEPPFDDEVDVPARIRQLGARRRASVSPPRGDGVRSDGGGRPDRGDGANGAGDRSAVGRPAVVAHAAVAAPAGERPLPALPAQRPLPRGSVRSSQPGRGRAMRPEVISAGSVPGWSQESDVGVTMTASAALPSAARSGAALARALLEVLAGTRPLAQLRAHCAPDVFAGLEDAPMLHGRDLPRLLTTRVCEPADGVAEVSAVFRRADRVRAMALRLQGVDGRWRITALQLG